MQQTELIRLWKSCDENLNYAIRLNEQNTREILKLKTKSVLSSMRPVKLFAIIIGLIWVLSGGIIVGNIFVYGYGQASHFFLYSATLQIGLTGMALFIYIYQLVLIQTTDISDNIVKTQKRLAQLRSSTLLVTRILLLQLPLWTTFYLSGSRIMGGDLLYIMVNGVITALFTYVALWLFFNIRYENKDKRWFRYIFEGKEWTPVIDSMNFCKELETYENETKEL